MRPLDWRERRQKTLQRTRSLCSVCYVGHGSIGYREPHGAWRALDGWRDPAATAALAGQTLSKITLALVHKNGDTDDWRLENLTVMCHRCIMLREGEARACKAARTRLRRKLERSGQLPLFDPEEILWIPKSQRSPHALAVEIAAP